MTEIFTLERGDPDYPGSLRAIHEAPERLYVRGHRENLEALRQPMVAIVGARACTDYGAHVARSFGRDLAAAGVTVVSGLARGIDGWAHRGAVEAGGRAVAVLGCGIDITYPRVHATLADDIVGAGGLIISEYPENEPPAPWRFPARNRIVAGLCSATVVVEARERSGSLITTDLALEFGRRVGAVPGEITSIPSRGSNDLIRRGLASAIVEVADILALTGVEAPA